ncbi:hypothetical protein Tco_0982169 [Tanacetum coccineum]
MVPTQPIQCASSYGDFGCLPPNKRTDSKEDEKVFENTRSVTKEDKDEQGKEEKGVVNYFEVVLQNKTTHDGWYFLNESGLSKESLCRSDLKVHLLFHVDRLETGSQVKTWDPGIKGCVEATPLGQVFLWQ